jgi:pyrroloquinoline quinone (PQQ) biosynthesis protein C
MSYVQNLDATLSGCIAELNTGPFFARFLSGRPEREPYIQFLVQTYHYVRYTSPYLKLAGETLMARPEPFYQRFGEHFMGHADEEDGHDEWLLSDLRHLGVPAEVIEKNPPHPAVRAYNEYFRFCTTSAHPLAVFGIAFILEGVSAQFGTPMAENLLHNSNIPGIERAITFVKGHGHTDQAHTSELREVLGQITDPGDQQAIGLCARIVAQLYCAMVADLSR